MVFNWAIGCGVSLSTFYCRNAWWPTSKSISKLSCGCLGWSFTVIFRCFAVGYVRALQFCAIFVLEDNFVLVFNAWVGCSVNLSTLNHCNSRWPTSKGISKFCCCVFGWGCAIVNWSFTVGYIRALKFCSVFVLEDYFVLVLNAAVGSGIGLCTFYCCDSRWPSCKGVGKLCVCWFYWSLTIIFRSFTVDYICALKFCSVFVLEDDFVLVLNACVSCGISLCTFYHCDSRWPTSKGIGKLCSWFFYWSFTCINRSFTIGYVTFLKFCSIFVLEDYFILVLNTAVSCGIGLCTFNHCDSRWPTSKSVSKLSGCCFFRSSASVNRCFTVSYVAALKFCSVFVLEDYFILIASRIKGCSVGLSTFNYGNCRRPTGEAIGKLCSCRFFRSFTVVNRCFTVSYVATL